MVNRRNAPRRKVVDIYRTGSYGKVLWAHQLECGHVQAVKRRAPSELMACTDCVERKPTPVESILDDPISTAALVRERLAAGLAQYFHIPIERVNVVMGQDYAPAYAIVSLPAEVLRGMGLIK